MTETKSVYVPKSEVLGKISIAKIHGRIKAKELKDKEVKLLVRVWGQARVSKIGDAVILVGEFRATSYLNGDSFTAKQLTMPAIATDLVQSAMADSEGQPIDFALDIGVKSSKGAMGYDYAVKPVLAPVRADILATLAAKFI